MARFVLCKCGKHGRIEAPKGGSGVVSGELGSKEGALKALASGIEKGYVSNDEATAIRHEIEVSGLAATDRDMDHNTVVKVAMLRAMSSLAHAASRGDADAARALALAGDANVVAIVLAPFMPPAGLSPEVPPGVKFPSE